MNKVTRQCCCYAVQKEGAALKTLAVFVKPGCSSGLQNIESDSESICRHFGCSGGGKLRGADLDQGIVARSLYFACKWQ
jgi:hypothetical protein